MNTITTSHAVSKGNTPAFKGYVDKSVYRYAAKLEKALVKDVEKLNKPRDKYFKHDETFRRVFVLRMNLKKLEEKVKNLDVNTFVTVRKEKTGGTSIFDPIRNGLFLSVRNSKIKGESVGEFSPKTELLNNFSPYVSTLALGDFVDAVNSVNAIKKPDSLIAANGNIDILARKFSLKSSPFSFIGKFFLRRDEANLKNFIDTNNIQGVFEK